jgi:hypothetical protein
MARSQRVVQSAVPPAVAFAFVSDFRHAPLWDPQTRSAEKLGDGPIGIGTRFVLVGGVAGLRMELPYEIVAFDPPHRLVLEGSTRWVRYRDQITFEADGPGTRIVYDAEMELRSALRIVGPLLPLMFDRIAEAATRGMPRAIEQHAGTPDPLT